MSGALSAAEIWNVDKTELPAHLQKSNIRQQVEIPASAVSSNITSVKVDRLTGMPESSTVVNRQLTRRSKFTADPSITGDTNFVVMLNHHPMALYTGGINGLAATHLDTYAKEDGNSSLLSVDSPSKVLPRSKLKAIKKSHQYQNRVIAYREFLKSEQQQLINAAAEFGFDLQINRSFTDAVNAVTVTMNQNQAAQLAKLSSVKSISPVQVYMPTGVVDGDFVSSHEVIAADKAWNLDSGYQGEGMIIGIADTGINTDSKSFTAIGDDGYRHTNPIDGGGYLGDCATQEWAHLCNDKLIGVYSYPEITSWYRSQLAKQVTLDRGEEVNSNTGMIRPANGKDYVGHGSHTAGIAGGNVVYDVDYLYREFRAGPGVAAGVEKLGTVTGVAPHANVISYQVCLPGGGGDPIAGCLSDVMLASIEQAIADGVDVLNWSIGGGSRDPWGDPILQGFLSLKEQGVHVTAAAGNTGGYFQVSNVTPWSLTVAATDLGRSQKDIGSAGLQYSVDAVDFNAIDLGGSFARSISGEATGIAALGADFGACINNDCSLAPVCEDGYEMIDSMCYLQCSDNQERNGETLECELKQSNSGGDNGGANGACLIGEEEVFGECVDDHVHGPKSYESICEGREVELYPGKFGNTENDLQNQGYYCADYTAPQCPENHQGLTGESAGKCCAYSVETNEDSKGKPIWPDEPYNVNDEWYGACCGPNGCAVQSNGFIEVLAAANSNIATIDSTIKHSSESSVYNVSNDSQENLNLNAVQAVAPVEPVLKMFKGDPHCLDFDSWKDPVDPTQEFDFNNKILVCARGDDTVEDNLPRLVKAENAGERGAAGFVLYNDNPDYDYDRRLALAVNIKEIDEQSGDVLGYRNLPYIHVGSSTWKKGLGRTTLRQTMIENEDIYLTIKSVKKQVNYDPKRIKDLAGFSSKGPNTTYPSLMGPTIAAPGANIYSAYTNDGAFQNKSNSADYAFESGTSMAAPHMAGVMALMKQARGDEWTANELESAVMLTAGDVTGGSWARINCSGIILENGIDVTDYANSSDEEICPEYDEDNILHQKFVYEAPVIDPETGELVKDGNEILQKVMHSYFERQLTRSWEAGSGLVNVENAIDSALIMDESHANFIAADPKMGGDLTQLNLPYLFNGECANTCRWTRTFTSTKLGANTWHVNTETSETSLSLSASPTSFTLTKGQSITVLFTANIKRSTSANSKGTSMVSGTVHLVPENGNLGTSRLPVGVALNESKLPLLATGVASENIGQFPINGIAPWGSTTDLQAKVYQQGGVNYFGLDQNGDIRIDGAGEYIIDEADTSEGGTFVGIVDLPLDNSPSSWDWENARNEDSVRLIWVDVPKNTKLLAVDVLERIATTSTQGGNPGEFWLAGDLFIGIGRDNNRDGEIQFQQEGMCLSSSDLMNNNCMLQYPEEGRYWIYLQNVNQDKSSTGFYEYLRDSYKYSISIITDEESESLHVNAPDSYDGTTPITLDLTYDVELNQGDALYGMVELGTSQNNLNNLGAMPVKLIRGEDAFTVKVSDEVVKAGNYIRVDVNYAKNHTGYQRTFDLEFEVPDGLNFIPYSLGGDPRFVTDYSENSTGVTVSGYQPNSYNLYPFYQMSTNVNPNEEGFEDHPLADKYNPMCMTPPVGNYFDGTSPEGKYIDMAKLNPRGATPPYGSDDPNRMGSWKDQLRVNVAQLFGYGQNNDFNLYNAPNSYQELRISPMGYIDSGTDYPLFGVPYGDPFGTMYGLPDIRLGPLMVGGKSVQLTTGKVTPEDALIADDAQGITLGAFMTDTNKNILIEWDNAYTIEGERFFTGSQGIANDDSYDFQAILDLEYSYEIGSYEVIYAYDNLNMVHGQGTVGFHGMAGIRGAFGPAGGFRNEAVAYGDLDEVLHDDLVICFDFIGEDYSKTGFSFWVKVAEDYAGEEIDLTVKTKLNRITKSVTNTLKVAGNISINPISDITLNQGEVVTLPVLYSDLQSTVNEITASSDGVLTTVEGNEPGSMLTIEALCDFQGTTVVDVMVADIENSADKAVASFNVEVVAVAGFKATADCDTSDESVIELEQEGSSSGGALAFMLFTLVALLSRRRISIR